MLIAGALLAALAAVQDAPSSVEWQLEELIREINKAPVLPDPAGTVKVEGVKGGPSDVPLVDRTVELGPMDAAVGTVECTAAAQVTVEILAYDGVVYASWGAVKAPASELPRADIKGLAIDPKTRDIYPGKRLTLSAAAGPGRVFQYVLMNARTRWLRGRVVIRATAPGSAAPPPVEDRGFLLRDSEGRYELPLPLGWLYRRTGHADRPLLMVPPTSDRTNFSLHLGPALKGPPDWEAFVAGLKKTLEGSVSGLSIGRKEAGRCGDHPAILVEWSFQVQGTPMKSLQYVVAAPSALYTLTWTASTAAAPQHLKAAESASLAFRALK